MLKSGWDESEARVRWDEVVVTSEWGQMNVRVKSERWIWGHGVLRMRWGWSWGLARVMSRWCQLRSGWVRHSFGPELCKKYDFDRIYPSGTSTKSLWISSIDLPEKVDSWAKVEAAKTAKSFILIFLLNYKSKKEILFIFVKDIFSILCKEIYSKSFLYPGCPLVHHHVVSYDLDERVLRATKRMRWKIFTFGDFK